MSHAQKMLKALWFVLWVGFVSLVLLEIVLRLFFPISFSMELEYVPDGYLGTRLQPDREYRLPSGGTCTVNNLGFRGTGETSIAKPPGTIRVVALGGSSTFCYRTGDEETWVRVLEKELQERYGPSVEVINAGVPGYSIVESKINYLYQIRPLDPDLVIVYHTWNDLKFFHLIEKGEYPKKGVFAGRGFGARILRHFQFAWRIRNYLHDVVYARRRENTYGRPGATAATIAPDGRAQRWERKNYDDLAQSLSSDSVLGVFVSQGGLLSAYNLDDPDVQSVVYAEYMNLTFEDLLKQWQAVSRIIETSAAAHGLTYVDAYDSILHTREYFMDHVHLTPRGNARLAQVLFDALVADPRADSLFHPTPAP